ncbi:MAG: hypothetical protein H6826_14405 [Planctomycetes bacterium]|nr:hypothetical protein [Planctomycetota bacterium]
MSRQNIQQGYTRVGLTVPTPLAKRFRDMSDRYGPRGVKKMGTLALSLLAGLPDETIQELLLWAFSAEQNPLKSDPAGAALALAELVRKRAGEELEARGVDNGDALTEFYIDRIIDPEIMGVKKPNGPKKNAG